MLLLIVGMYIGGIKGILWGMTISSYFICFYNSVLVRKYIGYSLIRQFMDLLPIIVINVISYILAYMLNSIIQDGSIVLYAGVFATYIISYIFLSLVFRINTIGQLKEVLNKVRRK